MKNFLVEMRKHSGFTLVEMSIVLFIIALLILIILPNLAAQRKHATRVHEDAMVNVVQTQIDLYENNTGQSANSYADLEGGDYLTAAQVAKAQKEKIVIQGGKAVKQCDVRLLPWSKCFWFWGSWQPVSGW